MTEKSKGTRLDQCVIPVVSCRLYSDGEKLLKGLQLDKIVVVFLGPKIMQIWADMDRVLTLLKPITYRTY